MSEKQKVYSARKFLSKSTRELMGILTGVFDVLFDDGKTVTMSAHEVCISSFFWDTHRQLSWLPLLSTHTIISVMGGNLLNSSTHIKLFERIFWDTMDAADSRGKPLSYEDIDKIFEFQYRKSSEIYNYVCSELDAYTISVDNEDYAEIMYYPPFKEVVDTLYATIDENSSENGIKPESSVIVNEAINTAYAKATTIIMKDPYLSNNEVAIAARSSTIKLAQLLQVLVIRGNVTDIDSMIFPDPSTGNFATGFRDWYSLFIDTRTAAKSLFFSGKLLRDSEYNSRRLQFLVMTVETIYRGDCGSTKFLPFKLRPDTVDENGKVLVQGDFNRWLGKYFEDPDTKEIRELKPDDTKYIGQVLRFRSMIAGCKHPDPHGVCGVCFNSIHRIMSPGTNVGWMIVAALMQILNQAILAVKHVDNSSSSSAIVLDTHHKNFLVPGADGSSYKFSPALRKQQIFLEISEAQLSAASTILGIDDFESVSPSQLSELTQVFLIIGDPDGVEYSKETLILSYEKRNPFFTMEALKWIKEKKYRKTDKGNFLIDFTGWPMAEAFAQLPARHFNNADHAKDIADLIQGKATNVKDRKKRKQDGSVVDYFQDLLDLVTSRLPNVPASVVELIVYGASIRSSADNDYRTPKADTSKEMGLSGSTIPFRSMGAAVGYEHLTRELFTNTAGYDPTKTSSHIADVFVLPNETITDFERRAKKFGRVSEHDFKNP